jgi:hypothetical protein
MDFPFDEEDNKNNNNNNNNNTKIERIAIPPPQKYSSAYCKAVQKKSEYEDEEGNVKNFWREWKRGDVIDFQGETQGVILVAKTQTGRSEDTVAMPPRDYNWAFVLYKLDEEDLSISDNELRKKIELKYMNKLLDMNYADIKANEQNAQLRGHISLDFISVPFLDYGDYAQPMTREEVEANRKKLEVTYTKELAAYRGCSGESDEKGYDEPPAPKKQRKKKLYESDLKF